MYTKLAIKHVEKKQVLKSDKPLPGQNLPPFLEVIHNRCYF